MLTTHDLRAAAARSLSAMYATEVPAYTTLVNVATAVNADVLSTDPERAERLGDIDRVTAERHGAIRLGTAAELRSVALVFAAFGMEPVGFYDLRGHQATSLPIVSTAFRPTTREALALNPFRMFTSLLVTDDRRYFDEDLQTELDAFLDRRTLFPPELLELARRAEAEHGLEDADAERFLALTTGCFALSPEPIDRVWYERLARISGVAADIGGVTTTHLNHLTPRVLDIDDLYARMGSEGITMIDDIQGPPRWPGPDVLLRQTSFRALDEPRRFREADGSVMEGSLRVRFGEVEQRGMAVTRAGRERYDRMIVEVDQRSAGLDAPDRAAVKVAVWDEQLPHSELELLDAGLAFFEYAAPVKRPPGVPPTTLGAMIDDGWLVPQPIVYEDFLPRSAAGIFASNLSDSGSQDSSRQGSPRDVQWMSDAMGRPVHDPMDLYQAQSRASLQVATAALGIPDVGIADLRDGGPS